MQRSRARSAALFSQAQSLIPGGVNSPVRAFRNVGSEPFFVERGEGPYIIDVDGNRYVDYVMSWGPLIFGHAPSVVIAAVTAAAGRGTSFGASTEAELLLAERIRMAVPSMEKVRLVNSGTEAVMSAIRVARGFTGRDKVVKFEGCYHGHSDGLLSKAGSGLATFGLPDSAGVPANVTRDTLTLPYNDVDAFRSAMAEHGRDVAAVIVEPIAGNMGCVPPASGFLEALRSDTERAGALLIFDEVMTGFRLALGGAQELFGIQPDLSTFGKILGGGLPLAAYGGRSDIMDMVAPVGPVYQAGTLSGNPLAVAAGMAQVARLIDENPKVYSALDVAGKRLAESARRLASDAGVPVQVNQLGSMFTIFFTDQPATDYASAKKSDTTRFARFFNAVLDEGVYLPPSQFEAAFVSTEHSSVILDETEAAFEVGFRAVATG